MIGIKDNPSDGRLAELVISIRFVRLKSVYESVFYFQGAKLIRIKQIKKNVVWLKVNFSGLKNSEESYQIQNSRELKTKFTRIVFEIR